MNNSDWQIISPTPTSDGKMKKLNDNRAMIVMAVNAVLCAALLFGPLEMRGIVADILRFLLPLGGIVYLAMEKEMRSAAILFLILSGGAVGYFSETIGFIEFILFIPIMLTVLGITVYEIVKKQSRCIIFAPLLVMYLLFTGISNWQAGGTWSVGEGSNSGGHHYVSYAYSAGAMDHTHYKTVECFDLIESPVFTCRWIISEKEGEWG